jgi:peptidoglycan hydrolase-like protein with peptidoglycan-binding domain
MSRDLVIRIQTALLKAGNDPGPIDGIIGERTSTAIKAYQGEKGFAVGGLTHETINSLGVKTGR